MKTTQKLDKYNPQTRRLVTSVFIALALLMSTVLKTQANGRNQNPGIIPPNARFGGLTYGEWLVEFNRWSLSVPASVNPLLLGNEAHLSIGQPKQLWFLANTLPVVDRFFTVPAGKALYAVIFAGEWDNFICINPDTNYTVDQLRSIAKSTIDSFTDIQVEVDGEAVKDVTQYRATTPAFFSTLPENNIAQAQGCTDVIPGTYGPMVGDGYAIILAPLSVGEHTIHETGVFHVDPSDPSKDIHVEVLWQITVVPQNQ
jgi:hypothetical protein